jgi:hypothetical protein
LKAAFREATQASSSSDTTAAIQKKRFSTVHRDARTAAIIARDLRAGLKVTGLWPFDPRRLVKAAVVARRPPLTKARPQTPPQLLLIKGTLWMTPKSGSDLKKMMEEARKSSNSMDRSLWTIETKAAKKLNEKDAQIAALNRPKQASTGRDRVARWLMTLIVNFPVFQLLQRHEKLQNEPIRK